MSNVIDPGVWSPKPKPGIWARFEALLKERASPREVKIRRWSYSASVLLDGVEVVRNFSAVHRSWTPVAPDSKYKGVYLPSSYDLSSRYKGEGWMERLVDDILAWAANPVPPQTTYKVVGLVPAGVLVPPGYTVVGLYIMRLVVGEEDVKAARADLQTLGIKTGSIPIHHQVGIAE